MGTGKRETQRTRERIVRDRRQQLGPRGTYGLTADVDGLTGRVFAGPVVWGRKDEPPRYWEANHNAALHATALIEVPKRGRLARNRAMNLPVPRRASCDYLRQDTDPRNFYFY